MWAVLISGQQALETNAPRQAEDQNIGLSLCFCLATACMGHVAVGQTSPTVMKGVVSLFHSPTKPRRRYASASYQYVLVQYCSSLRFFTISLDFTSENNNKKGASTLL